MDARLRAPDLCDRELGLSLHHDGGLATAATLASPNGLATDGAGNVLISDTGNHRLWRLRDGQVALLAAMAYLVVTVLQQVVAVDRVVPVQLEQKRSRSTRINLPVTAGVNV